MRVTMLEESPCINDNIMLMSTFNENSDRLAQSSIGIILCIHIPTLYSNNNKSEYTNYYVVCISTTRLDQTI